MEMNIGFWFNNWTLNLFLLKYFLACRLCKSRLLYQTVRNDRYERKISICYENNLSHQQSAILFHQDHFLDCLELSPFTIGYHNTIDVNTRG